MIGLSKDKGDAERQRVIEWIGRTVLEEAEFVAENHTANRKTTLIEQAAGTKDRLGREML